MSRWSYFFCRGTTSSRENLFFVFSVPCTTFSMDNLFPMSRWPHLCPGGCFLCPKNRTNSSRNNLFPMSRWPQLVFFVPRTNSSRNNLFPMSRWSSCCFCPGTTSCRDTSTGVLLNAPVQSTPSTVFSTVQSCILCIGMQRYSSTVSGIFFSRITKRRDYCIIFSIFFYLGKRGQILRGFLLHFWFLFWKKLLADLQETSGIMHFVISIRMLQRLWQKVTAWLCSGSFCRWVLLLAF